MVLQYFRELQAFKIAIIASDSLFWIKISSEKRVK